MTPIALSSETPPSGKDVHDIYELKSGAKATTRSTGLRKRMRQSCYLDGKGRRLGTLERLKAQYRRDGLTLFLGAGVNKDSGVPGWRDLISELLAVEGLKVLSSDGRVARCPSCALSEEANLSLPAQFSLAIPRMKSSDLEERLYKSLYGSKTFRQLKDLLEKIPPSNKGKRAAKTQALWKQIQKEISQKNPSLAAIGDLLLKGGTRLKCNSAIHAVITTNADNLLQIYVMARARGRRLLNTVDRPSVGDHPRMISVFHLHGFLNTRGMKSENAVREEEPKPPTLVFRESEYFDVIAKPTGFANYTAHSFLQRTNVLFIGTSLDDLNLRRWLYTSYRERVAARAAFLRGVYKKEYEAARTEAEYASLRHFWLRSKNDLPRMSSKSGEKDDDKLARLIEHLTRDLGVEIIWYDDHSEVAKLVSSLNRLLPVREQR
jgi:SIR2-like domain